jgi:hypothetical protein
VSQPPSLSERDFTEEEHKKFQMRLGEGYDLKDDERYNKWRKWKESAVHLYSILFVLVDTQPPYLRNLFATKMTDEPLSHLRRKVGKGNKKAKGKRGKSGKKGNKDDCPICSKDPATGSLWIACDECNQWYHCDCVHITKGQAKEMATFKCPQGCMLK